MTLSNRIDGIMQFYYDAYCDSTSALPHPLISDIIIILEQRVPKAVLEQPGM